MRGRVGFLLICPFIFGSGHAEDTQTDARPSPAMMATVTQLATFMSRLRASEHVAVFAKRGVCIIENFTPYVFCGANAVSRWEDGFRAHVRGVTDLAASFGAAQDFSISDDRAYFALPTTWTGIDSGKHFVEHGSWAIVLQRESRQGAPESWRVLSYGWGVTDYTETP